MATTKTIRKLKIDKEGAKLALKTRANRLLWERNEFCNLLLHDTQKEMLQAFENSDTTMFFMLCSRRLGKSWLLSAIAIRECLSRPGVRVLYLSKTTTQLREITDQTIPPILETCPEALRPIPKKMENKWQFPNGSEIRVVGLDRSGGDAIRGVKAHVVIFDEACFMEDLKNILYSAVMPMVIASKGRILFGSTPPATPGHESIDVIAACEEQGALVVRTIDQCPLYGPKQIAEFERQAGGRDSTTFRREYLCEIITDSDRAILPAFNNTRAEQLVRDLPHPGYPTDKYVSMDLGFRDYSVALFAYWDYIEARLIIQDELVFKGATTDKIATAVRKKEKELWKGQEPYKRVCDVDLRFIADIRKTSNMRFVATKKDNKEAQVNLTNMLIQDGKIVISPRCKVLISHMKYGTWNATRTSFDRTESLGHCDAVDALVYLVRNVRRSSMPQSASPDYNPYEQAGTWTADDTPKTKSGLNIRSLFARRRNG